MSFLDTICCAFGAVILLYMIINAAEQPRFRRRTPPSCAPRSISWRRRCSRATRTWSCSKVSLEVTEEKTAPKASRARLSRRPSSSSSSSRMPTRTTISEREAIEQLKEDLKSLDESKRRLEGGTKSEGQPGTRVKGFVGTGDRQYLTRSQAGRRPRARAGRRFREHARRDGRQRDPPAQHVGIAPASRRKWRRTVRTVDWITTQIPPKSQFQVYAFNTQARPMIAPSAGKWLSGATVRAQ